MSKFCKKCGRELSDEYTEQPVLTDGKQILAECGHSVLYRCYSDSDKCLLCDLEALDNEIYI